MTRTASTSRFLPEFDEFLFAAVGDDKAGMPLTVLSVLARQNVDPWAAAAELARLPRQTAIQKLAALIATLPDDTSTYQSSGAIAACLVALLPRQPAFEAPMYEATPTIGSQSPFIYVMMLFLLVMLGVQLFAAGSRMPAHATGAHAQAVSKDAPKLPVQNHGT